MIDTVEKRYLSCFIASTEDTLFEGEIYSIKANSALGKLEILPAHAPMMAQLLPGALRITKLEMHAPEQYFYITGGTIEVLPHHVTVLANVGKSLQDLSQSAIDEAKSWADNEEKTHQIDYQYVLSELAQVTAQQQMLHKVREIRDK